MSRRCWKILLLGIVFFFLSPFGFADSLSEAELSQVLPGAEVFVRENQPLPHYLGYTRNQDAFVGVAFTTSEVCPYAVSGYRSEISILLGVNPQGKIVGIKVLQEDEDDRYTKGLIKDGSWFIEQFKDKNMMDEFIIGKDIDAITGATISSSATAHSIEESLFLISTQVLNLDRNLLRQNSVATETEFFFSKSWTGKFIDLLLLFGLFGLALYGYIKRNRYIRYFALGFAFFYLGILKGGGASINDVIRILRLDFPAFYANIYWYGLWTMVILSSVFLGRFYCGWLCPFGAVQEGIHRLSPCKNSFPFSVDKYARLVKYINLIVIFVIAFIVGNILQTGVLVDIIEPFSTFFRFYGSWLAWIFLISMLAVTFLIPRCYCRYFCPLGAFFTLMAMVSSPLKLKLSYVELPQNKSNCKGCKDALKVCQMGGICFDEETGKPWVEERECIQCNECKLICPAILN